MRRKLLIAAAAVLAALAACVLAICVALAPGEGPTIGSAIPPDADAVLHLSEPGAALDALSSWEELAALRSGRLAREFGLDKVELGGRELALARHVLGRRCALALVPEPGGGSAWLLLSKIGLGLTAREWLLRHFAPEGMLSVSTAAPGGRIVKLNAGGAVGTVWYSLAGDLLVASDSEGALAAALERARGKGPETRAGELRGEECFAVLKVRSLRELLPGITGISESDFDGPSAFLGLPWPAEAGEAILGRVPAAEGAVGVQISLGFDGALLPERPAALAALQGSEWAPLDVVPREAFFLWTWRGLDGWHLVNLFALLARDQGEDTRDPLVRKELERAVLVRMGRFFTGDYAVFAVPQETREERGGYPAVEWVFALSDPAAAEKEMLALAARWSSGLRREGAEPLPNPYVEEELHGGARMYLLRGSFVHATQGYDPCFAVVAGHLVCSSSSPALRRSIDAAAGKSPRLELDRAFAGPGPRSFLLCARRPSADGMRQLSNLYDYEVELYRRAALSPAEALTDSTDYRLRYEIFAELATLVERLAVSGVYEQGNLRMTAAVAPEAER
jgi:hypothetical protein